MAVAGADSNIGSVAASLREEVLLILRLLLKLLLLLAVVVVVAAAAVVPSRLFRVSLVRAIPDSFRSIFFIFFFLKMLIQIF